MAKKRRGTRRPATGKAVPVTREGANSPARLEIVARNGLRRTDPVQTGTAAAFAIPSASGAGLVTNGQFAIFQQDPISTLPDPKHAGGSREQAQLIAVEAMQAETTRAAMRLARQAVAIDPLCLDARTILAVNSRSRADRIAQLEDALSDAEQRLGKEFFRKNMGEFARYEEGRAYLRALYSLSMELLADGQIEDCVENIEALLDLDPEDEMALRDQLLSLYLLMDDVESADDVLTRFEDDGSALFEWARVLVSHIFRQFDDASRQLQAARAANSRVEAYLTGGREFPTEQPIDAEPGTDEEAAYCAFHLATAWQLRPLAGLWLSQGGPPGPASVIDLVGMFKR